MLNTKSLILFNYLKYDKKPKKPKNNKKNKLLNT